MSKMFKELLLCFCFSNFKFVYSEYICTTGATDKSYCSKWSLHQIENQVSGSVENVELENHSNYTVKSVSQKPPIFEIDDFLSGEECEHFIKVATETGLKESQTYSHSAETRRKIIIRDTNRDRRLSVNEMMLTLEDTYDMYLTEEDILLMYKKLNIDKNHDDHLTPEELNTLDSGTLQSYLEDFVTQYPHKRSRYSRQIWLFADGKDSKDPLFKRLQDRVQKLTKLNPILIQKSDFQVVNYGKLGHYNAHLDSARMNKEIPCCTRKRKKNCRICRFATVLFYLNNVEKGGETAFPIAGNDTYDGEAFLINHQQNLMQHCHESNLKIFPKKGKAVLWYNHVVDEEAGWVGDVDDFTWHGGCPVVEGNKWIANFWIKFTDDPEELLNV